LVSFAVVEDEEFGTAAATLYWLAVSRASTDDIKGHKQLYKMLKLAISIHKKSAS
jgi:hypothetical protein